MAAFDTDGAILAPRHNGSITGLYPWTWPELPKHARAWIERMAEGGQISRYRDLPRDLLAALLEAASEQSNFIGGA